MYNLNKTDIQYGEIIKYQLLNFEEAMKKVIYPISAMPNPVTCTFMAINLNQIYETLKQFFTTKIWITNKHFTCNHQHT